MDYVGSKKAQTKTGRRRQGVQYGDDGWEIEPIVGMGQLKWNVMLGMLWNVGYDGYIIIEPHGDVWAEPENRWKHIVLAKRHLEQYMIP